MTAAMGWAFNHELHRDAKDPFDGLSGSEKSALGRKVLGAAADYRKAMLDLQWDNPFLLAEIIEYSYADGISAADLSLEMDLDVIDLSANLMSIESNALTAISTGERIKWHGNGVGPTAGLLFDVVSGGVTKSIPTLNWMSRTKMGYDLASKMLSSNNGVSIACTVSNGCSWGVGND